MRTAPLCGPQPVEHHSSMWGEQRPSCTMKLTGWILRFNFHHIGNKTEVWQIKRNFDFFVPLSGAFYINVWPTNYLFKVSFICCLSIKHLHWWYNEQCREMRAMLRKVLSRSGHVNSKFCIVGNWTFTSHLRGFLSSTWPAQSGHQSPQEVASDITHLQCSTEFPPQTA